MSNTILITGSNGLLGQKLVHLLKQKNQVVATSLGSCLISDQTDFIYQSLDVTEEKNILQIKKTFIVRWVFICKIIQQYTEVV